MKRLLLILMFGMMFGQTKLETRAYELPRIEFNNSYYSLNIDEITGYDIEYAVLKIIHIKDFSVDNNTEVNLKSFFTQPNGSEDSNVSQIKLLYTGDVKYEHNDKNNIVYHQGREIGLYFYSGSIDGWADIILAITAEFPQEETGYIDEGFDYCINVGANLLSSPCSEEVAITEAIPSEIANNLTGIITQGGATSQIAEGVWVGSLNGLGGGKGYWFLSQIEGCFNYTCSE